MNEPLLLSFEYSKELEKERVINTIKRLEWYRTKGYNTIAINLPVGLDRDNLTNVSNEEILNAINLEYDEAKFIDSKKELTHLYDTYKARLSDFLNGLGTPVISTIAIQLTRYGMNGSYLLPNKIIINVSKNYNLGLLRTVLHEIVHLHIQHLIDTNNIDHWAKERIVDLLMDILLPELKKPQKMPMDTAGIDTAFTAHYPNVTRIIETVGGLNKATA